MCVINAGRLLLNNQARWGVLEYNWAKTSDTSVIKEVFREHSRQV